MRPQSWSASRVWITSGRPVAPAGAAGGGGGGGWAPNPPPPPPGRAVVVEIVEPGFAERDDLGVLRQRNQLVRRDAVFLIGIMRMGADRAIDVVIALGDRQKLVQLFHPSRNGDHAADAGRSRPRHDPVEILRKIRKIQVA